MEPKIVGTEHRLCGDGLKLQLKHFYEISICVENE